MRSDRKHILLRRGLSVARYEVIAASNESGNDKSFFKIARSGYKSCNTV